MNELTITEAWNVCLRVLSGRVYFHYLKSKERVKIEWADSLTDLGGSSAASS
jgi:hypothetical protein